MSAQEMAAWQTVIRVMAHEVMNSLTPVSSLAATAQELVNGVIQQLPAHDPHAVALKDASEALETVARRSQVLLHFVQNHRRLTKHLVTQIEVAPIQRIFARLGRLLANDLAARDIQLTTSVTPETLAIGADIELLDQALINLVRNAIEALRDTAEGRIVLSAQRDPDGRVAIAVADNGPGIALAREGIRAFFYHQTAGQRGWAHARSPDRHGSSVCCGRYRISSCDTHSIRRRLLFTRGRF
jgi:signal transduction histidine kinase